MILVNRYLPMLQFKHDLFLDVNSGFVGQKLLVRLDVIQHVLENVRVPIQEHPSFRILKNGLFTRELIRKQRVAELVNSVPRCRHQPASNI